MTTEFMRCTSEKRRFGYSNISPLCIAFVRISTRTVSFPEKNKSLKVQVSRTFYIQNPDVHSEEFQDDIEDGMQEIREIAIATQAREIVENLMYVHVILNRFTFELKAAIPLCSPGECPAENSLNFSPIN